MEHNADMMDVDEMDIDLGGEVEVAEAEAQAMNMDAPRDNTNGTQANGVTHSGTDIQHDKIHIRGLDNLSTEDIKRFASEHFAPESSRVEWIDDTSANIVYDPAQLAVEALTSFTQDSALGNGQLDPVDLRKAKTLSTHPHTNLYVRAALVTDVKQARAYDASRYYLLNPDKDPRERRRINGDRRGRNDYRDRRPIRRESEEEKEQPFDVNLYDDDAGALAARVGVRKDIEKRPRRTDALPGYQKGRRRGSDEELVDTRNGRGGNGRLRDRSASPLADGDGRFGFEEDESSNRRRARRRSFTAPSARPSRNAGKELLAAPNNAGKELVGRPAVSQGVDLMDRIVQRPSGVLQQSDAIVETPFEPVQARTSATTSDTAMELFPAKVKTIKHRRSRAFDAADGTGDLFASRNGTTLRDDHGDKSAQPRSLADRIHDSSSRDLASRISNSGPATNGRSLQVSGFSIRGVATQEENPGFSIRGAAGVNNPRVKELFPDRGEGNDGKELFSRFRGKTGRRTAEDLFT